MSSVYSLYTCSLLMVLTPSPGHADLFEKSLDTLASIMPVVVTLVLFLFPPLIANT
jgi:hypothetical protein